MIFNPDFNKPAQEIIFSRKKQSHSDQTISLNNIQVKIAFYQKHLGILLDEKLDFKQHVLFLKLIKVYLYKKMFFHSLPRKSLITIYKVFLRPLIDYGDIIYYQQQTEYLYEKLESIQYRAALAIAGAIQGTSREKM